VAAKYRNPATGETWTGRGKAPKWIEGQDRNKFAI
jgi:DNA-binding protein H-NS